MQTYYAAHLPLAPLNDGKEVDAAILAVSQWVTRRFKVEMNPSSGGSAVRRGVSINWSLMTGEAGAMFGVWIDQPDRSDRTWRWRTYVDIGVDGSAWVRVRLYLYSPNEGLLTNPKVEPGRPGIVRQLVDDLGIAADGLGLGEVMLVTRESAEEYVSFLKSTARRLPVVAVSARDDDNPALDPKRTADKLLGIAHVAELTFDGALEVTRLMGKPLSCYRGGVRIYWPGFTPSDSPVDHRLYLDGARQLLGENGLQREIFITLGQLAGLTVAEPSLRRALKKEKQAAALEASIQERAQAQARVSAALNANATIEAEEFAEFAAEYDALDERFGALELDAIGLQVEVDDLRRERDDARTALASLSADFAEVKGGEPVETVEAAPDSVAAAVAHSRSRSGHVVFLDEAFSSANDSQFGDPSRVLDDLALIEEIAREWANDELNEGPHAAFTQRCSAYRDGIGKTASQKFAADYSRTYRSEQIMLGPHIARGVGAVASILRIYMYFDVVRRVIVVGHVGRKLRDASNRN